MKKSPQSELREAVGEYLKVAEKYIKSGDLDKAMEQVELATSVDPKSAYAHAYKERIREMQREKEKKEGKERPAGPSDDEQRKIAEEAERKRKEAEEKKHHEEEETRRRSEEEAKKHEAEEEQRRKEKQQRLMQHLTQARRYFEERNLERALGETEKALQIDPNNPEAIQLDTAVHQEKLKKEDRAKQDARKKREEEERRKREEEERKLLEAEDAKQREAMKKVDGHLTAARDLVEQEEFEKALDEVSKALELAPRHEPAIQLEGEVRKQKMEVELRKAEEKIKRKEAEEKRRALLREIQRFIEKAESYLQEGKFEKALDEIIHAFSLDATHPQAKELAEKIQAAIEEKARAEEEAKRREEEERRRREEEEKRQAQLKKIKGHLQAAEEYLQKQKYEKALEELKRVYELDPKNSDAFALEQQVRHAEQSTRVQEHLEAAKGYLQKQKFEQAREEAKQALKIEAQNADGQDLMARIQEAEEEARRKAEEEAQRRQEEEEERKKEEKKRKIEAILAKAEEYIRDRKHQKALEEVTKLRAIDPENPHMPVLELKAQRGIQEEEEVRRLEAEGKRKVKTLLQDAESHFLNGKYEVALSNISKIFLIDEGNAEATELMESVQKAKEEEDKAAAAGVEIKEEQKVKARKRISPRRRAQRRRMILGGSAAFVVIAAILMYSLQDTFFPGPPSLFVAPFRNDSGNPQDDYIADGITAAFVSDFGSASELRTLGAATSLTFKNKSENPAAIGRQLRVSYVLTGSARRNGDRIEVSVELRDTSRGEKVWSKQYSESFTNLHAMREDVFDAVVKQIDIKLPDTPRPFSYPWSNDPNAVDMYMQAMALFRDRREQSLLSAIQLFDRVLAADPRFAHASAGKAYALTLLYEREWEDKPGTLEEASKIAKAALAIDPAIVLAHRTLGAVAREQRSYAAAVDHLQKALTINAHDAGSHIELAFVYGMEGNIKRALESASKAVELDPKNFEAQLSLALINHLARNYKAAVAAYDETTSLRPDILWDLLGLYDGALIDMLAHERAQNIYSRYLESHPDDYTALYRLARSYQIAGNVDASFPHLRRVIALAQQDLKRNPRSADAFMYIGLAQTRLGNFKEGVDESNKAVGLASDDYHILYNMAGLYAMQKRPADAMNWFRRAVEKRYSFKGVLDLDLYNIRNEAEYLQTIREP